MTILNIHTHILGSESRHIIFSASHVSDPAISPRKPNLVTPIDPNNCTCKCSCDKHFLSRLEPDVQLDHTQLPSSKQQANDLLDSVELRECKIDHSGSSLMARPMPNLTTHTNPSPAVCVAKSSYMCGSNKSPPERVSSPVERDSSPVELDSILTHTLPSSPVMLKGCDSSAQGERFVQSEPLNPTKKLFEVPEAFQDSSPESSSGKWVY